MTVLPFSPSPAAARTPGVPSSAGAGEAAVAAGDFLAAFLAAMHGDGPQVGPEPAGPLVEEGALAEEGPLAPVSKPSEPETGTELSVLLDPTLAVVAALQNLMAPHLAAEGTQAAPRLVEEGALAAPRLVEEGALAPVSKPAEPENERRAPDLETVAAQPPRSTEQPALAPRLVEEGAQAAPRLVEEGAQAAPRLVEEGALAPVSKPAEPQNERRAPDLETVAAPPPRSTEQPTASLPTAIQPGPPAPVAPAAAPTAPTAPLVANTAPLDRVAEQVFGEVTSLVSRGNGTHRITMTLNPEQLGEVRVVMTVRDGTVHVRMAAGHEARAALLDGSPELSRLLETSGATETRIVVRDLPAALSTSTATPTNTSDSASAGNGSPDQGSLDQRAGTRADHQAKDGSDHNSPRSDRTDGSTSAAAVPRSSQSVTGTRVAGVDLTM